ncbi:VP4 [Rotavirus F chicken/03V0568/DEU/2003]|uniref:VP4 n=1 Tax=Rotavirus F chicken/03V0568/DEU/2003 TaxID=994994 RepID=M4H2P4_9REOV|nr:VP4 [Rotavirus F chicken/03V0568/DEU/2003]AFL91886.1 VP4 [Rotavirus F chicken/03V0568/DEU/2003]
MASRFWVGIINDWQNVQARQQTIAQTSNKKFETYIDTSNVGTAQLPPSNFSNDNMSQPSEDVSSSLWYGPNKPQILTNAEYQQVKPAKLFFKFETPKQYLMWQVDNYAAGFYKKGDNFGTEVIKDDSIIIVYDKTSNQKLFTSTIINSIVFSISEMTSNQLELTAYQGNMSRSIANITDQNFNLDIRQDYYSCASTLFPTLYKNEMHYVIERNAKVLSKALTEETVVSQAGLWKEVRYAADITLRFYFQSEAIRKGGFGYQFSTSNFKPWTSVYSYTRDNENVTAHVTVTLNGLSVYSQRGAVPTDFAIDRMECITNDTYMYIDYWDTSNLFRNMVYVRDLKVEQSSIRIGFWPYMRSLTLPVGSITPYYPFGITPNGVINADLICEGITLSTQFTDAASMNSLRFIFKFKNFDPPNGNITRMKVTGVPAAYMQYAQVGGNPGNPGDPFNYNVRFSMISLIPANDEYKTPIAASVTVRQDLDIKLSQLRQEFNQVAENLAVSQAIGLATMPFDMLSMFSGTFDVVQNIGDFTSTLFSKFSKTTTGVQLLKYTKYTDELVDVATSTDDVLEVATIANKAKIMKSVETMTDSLDFEDISTAVLNKAMREIGTQTDYNSIAQIAAESIDMIPTKAYRVIDNASDTVYEVSKDANIAYKLTDLSQIQFDIDKFKKLSSESPVLSAIIDFKTIKMMNQANGKLDRITLDNLLASNPQILKTMIAQNNPIIVRRVQELIDQCRL